MRSQYTTAICGACGKKKAYVTKTYSSSNTIYEVNCMACRAQTAFLRITIDGSSLKVWPGSLEEAARTLKPKEQP